MKETNYIFILQLKLKLNIPYAYTRTSKNDFEAQIAERRTNIYITDERSSVVLVVEDVGLFVDVNAQLQNPKQSQLPPPLEFPPPKIPYPKSNLPHSHPFFEPIYCRAEMIQHLPLHSGFNFKQITHSFIRSRDDFKLTSSGISLSVLQPKDLLLQVRVFPAQILIPVAQR